MARTRTRNHKGGGSLPTFLGLLAGGVIGAGVALVFTPETGERNRQRLQQWVGARTNDLQTQAQAKTQELKTQAQAKTEELRTRAQAKVEDIQTRVEDKVMG